MNWYEKVVFGLSLYVKRFSNWLRDVAMEWHKERLVKQWLPTYQWPEHEPWYDNFSTREGEHDHT